MPQVSVMDLTEGTSLFLHSNTYLSILEAGSLSVELRVVFFHFIVLFQVNLDILRTLLVGIVQCSLIKNYNTHMQVSNEHVK